MHENSYFSILSGSVYVSEVIRVRLKESALPSKEISSPTHVVLSKVTPGHVYANVGETAIFQVQQFLDIQGIYIIICSMHMSITLIICGIDRWETENARALWDGSQGNRGDG